MFSLSQVIFLRNWLTTGCSFFLWFGLSYTIIHTTSTASASPDLSTDRTSLSNNSVSQANSVAAFAIPHPETLDLALVDSAAISPEASQSAIPPTNETTPQPEPLQSIVAPERSLTLATLLPDAATQTEASDRETIRPLDFAILLPDAESPDTSEANSLPSSGEGPMRSETVAQQSVTIPTFANSNECFVDCDPSQRFDFRPPAQFSLQPVAPRVAQAPYLAPPPAPTTPSSVPGTVPSAQLAPSASPASDFDSPLPSTALTPPSLQFQGVYIYQGDESSARARVTGVYPLTPRIQVGGTLDLTDGDIFSEGGDDGVNINELYVTLAPQELPNLRFVLGQLDLTSYFDRNSFAKDSATQFFNPVFSTNPALAAAGIGSRQGALVNWTITDNLEARAVIFSSDRSISEFELNAFAGELGLRLGNLLVRGTYVTSEDSGSGDGFQEIFNFDRGNGQFGAQEGDRENAYGINAEYFIPEISLGLFGRYGYYENTDLDEDGDAFNFGVNVYDLFLESDRLGVGYGQALSNDQLRRDNDDEIPSVLEVFYDFRLLPGLRVGVSYQSLNEFSESIAGFRVRGDFNLTPRQP